MRRKCAIKVMNAVLAASMTISSIPVSAHAEESTEVIESSETENSADDTEEEIQEELPEESGNEDSFDDSVNDEITSENQSESSESVESSSSTEESTSSAASTEEMTEDESSETGSTEISSDEEIISESHEHEFVYEPNGDGTHTKSCKDESCDFEAVTEDCEFDENGICKDCRYEEKETEIHEHEFVYESNEDGTHTKSCKDESCDFETVTEDCEFDENGICKDCGYEQEKEVEKFVVTFLGFKDTKISSVEVKKGTKITDIEFPDAPEVEGYDFDSWDISGDSEITEDILIRALYKEKKKEFVTVVFKGYANKVINEVKIEKGTKLADDFEVEAPEVKGMDFIEWSVDYSNLGEINEDMTIEAVYDFHYINRKTVKHFGNSVVSVSGNIPQDAIVDIEDASYAEQYKEEISEEKGEEITVYDAYDIKVRADLNHDGTVSDDEIWQPQDYDKSVEISVSNVEEIKDIEKYADKDVNDIISGYRISDEGKVTELDTTVNGTTVSMTTDHFTIFTVGGTSYDTADGYRLIDGKVYKLGDATATYNIGKNNVMDIKGYLFDDGLLYIEGTGEMREYTKSFSNKSPFNNNKNIFKLVFSNTITSIGNYAFYNCTGLTGELHLPNSLTSIDDYAFSGCKGLTGDLIIPDSVTTIGDSTFSECSGFDGELHLPEGLTSIGNSAFNNCSGLTGDLIIPDSIVTIGSGAFFDCNGFNGSLKLSNHLTKIENNTFSYCSGFIGELFIPDGVISIGTPTTYISDGAFYNCSGFTSLKISNSVQKIETGTFCGCESLSNELHLPSSLTSIGNYAFRDCSLFGKMMDILATAPNLVYIGEGAFYNCSHITGDLILPENYTYNSYAFEGCNGLNGNLYIPESWTEIPDGLVYGCSEIHLSELSNNVTKIGRESFSGCKNITLESLPDSIIIIEQGAFNNCEKISLSKLPNSLTTLKGRAFSGCKKITISKIPDGVTEIGGLSEGWSGAIPGETFSNCSSIIAMDLNNVEKMLGYNNFENCISLEKIIAKKLTYVYAVYAKNAPYKGCTSLQEIEYENKTRISDYEFYSLPSLKKITGLSNVTYIGEDAFRNCYNLSEIDDLSNVETIERIAFHRSSGNTARLKIYNANEYLKSYDWDNDNVITKWDDLDSITATYTGADIAEGMKPDVSDFKVTATYDHGEIGNYYRTTTTNLAATSIICEPVSVGDNNEVTVSYTENGITKTAIVNVTGIAKAETGRVLNSISAVYYGPDVIEGLEPDVNNDIKVTGHYIISYNNGTTENKDIPINSLYCAKIYRKAQIGQNQITVEFSGFSIQIPYIGIAKSEIDRTLDSITVEYSGIPVVEGLSPKKNDILVKEKNKVTYNNGTVDYVYEIIDSDNYILTADTIVGSNTATVEYNGKTTTFSYTGIAKAETGRVLNSISTAYTGPDIIEGLLPDKDDITVTGHYTVSYDNGTTENKDIVISSNDISLTASTEIGQNTATVEYAGKTSTFTYTGIAKSEVTRTLKSITASSTVLSLKEGQTFGTDNITVKALYDITFDNGTTDTDESVIANDKITFSGDVRASVGTNTITVSYEENGITKTTVFSYNGVEKAESSRTLQSINATYTGSNLIEGLNPEKRNIKVDMTYKVFYDNGTSDIKTVTYDHADSIEDITVSADPAVVGINSYTVSYKGKTSTITVNAVAKQAISNAATDIKIMGSIPTVIEKQSPDLSGLIVKETHHITYDNGSEEDVFTVVSIDDCTVTGDTTAHAGTNVLTVAYNNHTATVSYEANEKQAVRKELQSIDSIFYPDKLEENKKLSQDSIKAKGTFTIIYDNGDIEDISNDIENVTITVEDKAISVGENTVIVTVESDSLKKDFAATIIGIKKPAPSKPAINNDNSHSTEPEIPEIPKTVVKVLGTKPIAVDFPVIKDIVIPKPVAPTITDEIIQSDTTENTSITGFKTTTSKNQNSTTNDSKTVNNEENNIKNGTSGSEEKDIKDVENVEAISTEECMTEAENSEDTDNKETVKDAKKSKALNWFCSITGLFFSFLLLFFWKKKDNEDDENEQ